MDRRETGRLFRTRLREAMEAVGITQSGLARRVGVDRSTLSQLLAEESDRLPRADTVAAMAAALQVSLDWLLGLRQEAEPSADILDQAVEIASGDSAAAEEQLQRWHEEAAGYKIRYVPSTIPDLLKTDRVIEYEFTPFDVVTPRMSGSARRIAWPTADCRKPTSRSATLFRRSRDLSAAKASGMGFASRIASHKSNA